MIGSLYNSSQYSCAIILQKYIFKKKFNSIFSFMVCANNLSIKTENEKQFNLIFSTQKLILSEFLKNASVSSKCLIWIWKSCVLIIYEDLECMKVVIPCFALTAG